jgi:hypothetical protein
MAKLRFDPVGPLERFDAARRGSNPGDFSVRQCQLHFEEEIGDLSGSSAALAFGRSPNEDLCHPIDEFVKVDGFLHPRRTFQQGRVSLMTAVAGDQNKRHFVARELIGHRRRVPSIQVSIQQRPIETILAYGRDSLFEGRYRPDT